MSSLVLTHILKVEPRLVGVVNYHSTEGLFNPFESFVADSFVLKYIKENWTTDAKTHFLLKYGLIQRKNLALILEGKSSMIKLPIQKPGDYSLAALQYLKVIGDE